MEETTPSATGTNPGARIEVRAWSPAARIAAGVWLGVAVLNVLYLASHLVHDMLEGTNTAPPRAVALGLVLFSAIPVGLCALLRRLNRVTLEVLPEHLVLLRGTVRFEIPVASITGLTPWRIPLPGAGLALRLTSGRAFRYDLETDDPTALLDLLVPALPAVSAAPAVPTNGALAFAAARQKLGRRGRVYLGVKHIVAPLILTGVIFRLDQMIRFGSPTGQYKLFGLASYLRTFSEFWMGTAGGLVVYASCWRLAMETLGLVLTFLMPARAGGIRKAIEIVCFVAYFVVIPGFVLFFLLR